MIPAPLYRPDYRGVADHDCDQEPPGVFEPGRYYRPVADGGRGRWGEAGQLICLRDDSPNVDRRRNE